MREPSRVFFPLGMFFGLCGVAIWPLYSFGVTATYSAAILWMAGIVWWSVLMLRRIRGAAKL